MNGVNLRPGHMRAWGPIVLSTSGRLLLSVIALAAMVSPPAVARENEHLPGDSIVRRVGEPFRDCEECPEMILVPAGSFVMGSPPSEQDRLDREGPQHRVTISKPFSVGAYEVTRGQYRRFVESAGYSNTNDDGRDSCWTYESGELKSLPDGNWQNPGYDQEDQHPVVCVTWEDAREYVAWLSDKTGENYRLLSESEWEYVARGGTTTARFWGESSEDICRYANGADEKTGFEWAVSCSDGHDRTAPARKYGPNAYGLYDVLGTLGSGLRTAGTRTTRAHRQTAPPGRRATAIIAWYAEARGTIRRRICGRRSEKWLDREAVTVFAASEWPGRSGAIPQTSLTRLRSTGATTKAPMRTTASATILGSRVQECIKERITKLTSDTMPRTAESSTKRAEYGLQISDQRLVSA